MRISDSKQIKVAHVIHLDGPGGGPRSTAKHVSYYCNFFQITVFHGGQGYLSQACQVLGIKTVKLPLDRVSTLLVGALMLWWHLFRLKPDLVILHGQWAAPVGAVVGKLAGVKKMIYICHWPAFYTDWDLFRVVRNYLSEWIPCRLVDRVISVSESNRYQYLLRGYIPKEENLLSIPNPISLDAIPTENAAEEIREKFGWKEEHCHVVSVSRLTDQKRMDWLLSAWVIIQGKCPTARLWIIGDGRQELALQKMASELKLERTCCFLGNQRNGWDFIAAADVVVMTSLYEARGNVVIEAMASGKAIVANNVDGICDSMENGKEGFLVPPAQPEKLAERLIELIENPGLRESMGKRGRFSVERFSTSKILNQYLYVIEKLLNEK